MRDVIPKKRGGMCEWNIITSKIHHFLLYFRHEGALLHLSSFFVDSLLLHDLPFGHFSQLAKVVNIHLVPPRDAHHLLAFLVYPDRWGLNNVYHTGGCDAFWDGFGLLMKKPRRSFLSVGLKVLNRNSIATLKSYRLSSIFMILISSSKGERIRYKSASILV